MLCCIVDSSFLVVPREKDPRDSLGTERKPVDLSGGDTLVVGCVKGVILTLARSVLLVISS